MSVLIEMCFISVVGGYVNVAQIASVDNEINRSKAFVRETTARVWETGDRTPEAFLARIQKTCGGKHDVWRKE